MSRDAGAPLALGAGVLFVLTGAALLLQELGVLALRWTYVLPIIVVAVGAAVLLSGVLMAHRGQRDGLARQPVEERD